MYHVGLQDHRSRIFILWVSCKNNDPKGDTSNWLADSLQKPQYEDDFLFSNFQLWTHILRSEVDQLIYSQTEKICCFVETLCK